MCPLYHRKHIHVTWGQILTLGCLAASSSQPGHHGVSRLLLNPGRHRESGTVDVLVHIGEKRLWTRPSKIFYI